MKNRNHRAVAHGVQELIRVPAGGERAGLRLAVADDAADEQIGVVERRAVGVQQRISQLAAFVDRAGSFRRDVAGDAAGKRELLEEPLHPLRILRDVGETLGVASLQPGIGDHARTSVTRSADVDHVEVVLHDGAVAVDVDEIEAGRGSPVPQQARLDVLDLERLGQQRIVVEINLSDRQIVRGAPVCIDPAELIGRERAHWFQRSISPASDSCSRYTRWKDTGPSCARY